MKHLKLVFVICILCISGCGGSSDMDFVTWQGNLQFDHSACDFVVSDPPLIDPAETITFRVRMGAEAGDNVRVIDAAQNVYDGTMTDSSSFTVLPDQFANPASSASGIQFSNISDEEVWVTEYFTYNAPHGCTHYFSGAFVRVM